MQISNLELFYELQRNSENISHQLILIFYENNIPVSKKKKIISVINEIVTTYLFLDSKNVFSKIWLNINCIQYI